MKTMETKSKLWNLACNRFRRAQSLGSCAGSKGQALVEFTLVFILFLVVAWIPADFGLAFYTGQLAQNASREGARIAAADRNLNFGRCWFVPVVPNVPSGGCNQTDPILD